MCRDKVSHGTHLPFSCNQLSCCYFLNPFLIIKHSVILLVEVGCSNLAYWELLVRTGDFTVVCPSVDAASLCCQGEERAAVLFLFLPRHRGMKDRCSPAVAFVESAGLQALSHISRTCHGHAMSCHRIASLHWLHLVQRSDIV